MAGEVVEFVVADEGEVFEVLGEVGFEESQAVLVCGRGDGAGVAGIGEIGGIRGGAGGVQGGIRRGEGVFDSHAAGSGFD